MGCKVDADCKAPAKCGGGNMPGICGCTFYHDDDHDGYGDPMVFLYTCYPPAGFVADGTDCNDEDPTVNPGRKEVCDYKDNNCNGLIDEGVTTTYYRDADGDGYGDPKNTIAGCAQPNGFILAGADCDDTRPDVHPGAEEICDGIDNNCDGIIDGIQRACTTLCGGGMETCTVGVWGGCTAPPVTLVSASQILTLGASASFACLQVKGQLVLGDDVVVNATNWVRVESGGSVAAGARAEIVAAGDVVLAGTASVTGSELSLTATGQVNVDGSARLSLQGANGVFYSGGGSASCSDGTAGGSGGAGGGARGGSGGLGGTCGANRTGANQGAGGAQAQDGSNGCSCVCASAATGGAPSGAGGGAPMAGGGGGGNGGAGGAGSAGSLAAGSMVGGAAGAIEGTVGVEPAAGGGGGGSGGTAYTYGLPCRGEGGSGGGLLRLTAMSFVNRGVIIADGGDGDDVLSDFKIGGGGGAGSGGSLVFHVATFDSTGLLTAQGGRGGAGDTGGAVANCSQAMAGGGGGGGGGKIFVAGPNGTGSATVVNKGDLLVSGGAAGTASCGLAAAQKGGDGWTKFQ
jgi:hypothetical protein